MRNPVHCSARIAAAAALLSLTLLAGCGGAKVTVPIRTQTLPARPADAPLEFYWSDKALETWLQLANNPAKAPDLGAAHLIDTHTLWENRSDGRTAGKVADLESEGQISKNHPREWLLTDLAATARQLGADAVIVNSIRATPTSNTRTKADSDAMWSDGLSLKVWLYAQAVRYE